METAPLTLAHSHARNAVLETKRSNPVAASEEHDLAAAEFAAAAQTTKDNEALRILNLLEQHHKKLGYILKAHHQAPGTPDVGEATTQRSDPRKSMGLSETINDHSPSTTTQPPRLVRPAQTGVRDLSSSIASNLASARGIPSHRQKRSVPVSPLVSNEYADGQFTSDEGRRTSNSAVAVEQQDPARIDVTKPSWTPPADVNPATEPNKTENVEIDTTIGDAPFQQFYSTFESLLSKLSAPLAFAGLPLVSHQPPSQPMAIQQTTKVSTGVKQRATEALQSSIDYSQLISRAALRAVRNDNSQNPSESFYVVPTSGGTTSYAEIMNRADRENSRTFRDHRRNISNQSNDDFVDASSTILPSPSRTTFTRSGVEQKVDGKTMEELSLENKALKHLSDTLSKRLHVFEMSAQTSSAALAQSIRSLHLSPMTTPENSRGKSKTTSAFTTDQIQGATSTVESQKLNHRITELEDILKRSDAKIKKRDEENAKLRDRLASYKDKWEGLKASAKAKREKQVQAETPRKRDKLGTIEEGGGGNGPEKSDQRPDDTDV